jgi:hypothetical protein
MGKLLILKLAEGDFKLGFPVTLQISNENARPTVEITGKLPQIQKFPATTTDGNLFIVIYNYHLAL